MSIKKTLGQPINDLWASPTFLLIITGALIGANFPIGKMARFAGVTPIIWAVLLSLGVCAMLFPLVSLRGEIKFVIPSSKIVTYTVITALISYVIPNSLLFTVIPHVGAGYAGIIFALSPVFTLAISMLTGVGSTNRLGIVGIFVGLLGAMIVSFSQANALEAPPVFWLLASLFIPFSLACGNVYRSAKWPKNASADLLAFWSHFAALIFYVPLLLVVEGSIPLFEFALVPQLALVQAILSGIAYLAFFRLQKTGGPVLLSQIGYVAAAVSLLAATTLLGESYAPATWSGAFVIAIGIFITIVARGKR
ncbi:DMT family transporter [Flexibacterium corallicola]|uniref:DMT family transporter n=1 Tax=Flexibacterium corallicola TaxID=3037259 RepID=UPI00286F0E22|nr:DMT family transporter [Pseudovibrio sp. M1P-2-3]